MILSRLVLEAMPVAPEAVLLPLLRPAVALLQVKAAMADYPLTAETAPAPAAAAVSMAMRHLVIFSWDQAAAVEVGMTMDLFPAEQGAMAEALYSLPRIP